jgi:hypothetical protein
VKIDCHLTIKATLWVMWMMLGVVFVGHANAATQTHLWGDATFEENRPLVAWCLNRNSQCGKPAADDFCQARHGNLAVTFTRARPEPPDRILRGINGGTSAVLLGGGPICSENYCSTFAMIKCSDLVPRKIYRHRITRRGIMKQRINRAKH